MCTLLLPPALTIAHICPPPLAASRAVKPHDLELTVMEEEELASGSESGSDDEQEEAGAAAHTKPQRRGGLETLLRRLGGGGTNGSSDDGGTATPPSGVVSGGMTGKLAAALAGAALIPGALYALELDSAGEAAGCVICLEDVSFATLSWGMALFA